MTTIVWNYKKGELGADKRMSWGPNNRYSDTSNKIMVGKDFHLVAAGDIGPVFKLLADALGRLSMPNIPSELMFLDLLPAKELLSFTDLFEDMLKDDKISSFSLAMFVNNELGKRKLYELYSNALMVETDPDRYLVMGTGGDYALGALAAGASTKRAIAIAAQYCHTSCAACDIVKPFEAM